MCETGIILDEIRFHLKHTEEWMRVKPVQTPLTQFHARSFVSPEPYGLVLVMSPWNYPVNLCLAPLIGAISAGNCAILKPSAYAAATSRIISEILTATFPAEYISVVEGGRRENAELLKEKFDYIFFTGSIAVGKTVMEAAAQSLTPVTLELGGKSPVIVDHTADLKLAARRIAFGKVMNAGQTCVEPDYLLIESCARDAFIAEYKKALFRFFPDGDMSAMATSFLKSTISERKKCWKGRRR
jgi:aldehyde dehydrogenase (NAD+)